MQLPWEFVVNVKQLLEEEADLVTVLVMEQVPVRKGHVKQVSFVAKAAHARAFNRNVEHNLNNNFSTIIEG